MKIIIAILLALFLSACGQKEDRMADNKVLCSLDKHEAFFVTPGAVDTSFLKRVPDMDAACKSTEADHAK